MKTDSVGEVIWEVVYGGEEDEWPYRTVLTSDGGILIAGFTRSEGQGGKDILLLKLDSDGEEEWHNTYGDSMNQYCGGVVELSNGDFAVCGTTEPADGHSEDIYLFRVNSGGDLIWDRAYDTGGSADYGRGILRTENDNLVIAGEYHDRYFFLFRTDSDGEIIWQSHWGDRFADQKCVGVIPTEEGGYVLGGKGRYEFTLMKTDADPANSIILDPAFPSYFSFMPPYPNPFNSTIRIQYQTPTGGQISVKVFDLTGREVANLFTGRQEAGYHQAVWTATGQSSGLYVCRMDAPGFTQSVKMVLVK